MKKFFATFTVILLSLSLLRLWYNEKLVFYILPKFNILVITASLILILTAIFLIFHREKKFVSEIPLFNLVSIFFILGLFIFFPPRPLSSASVDQRGINSDLASLKLKKTLNFKINSSQRTFADWIKIISNTENITKFIGEKAEIKGFTYKKNDEWYLSRFLIRCCAADASPVALRIKLPTTAKVKIDDWLTVKGVWQTDQNSAQPLFLEIKNWQKIPVPKNPYIY